MLGYDSDKTQLALGPFCDRRVEQGLKSNVEITKLSPLATQADANGGLRVCGDSKTKSGPKPKQLAT